MEAKEKQPIRWSRKLLHFLISAAIALVLGRVFEALLDRETVADLRVWQTEAYVAARSFSPWSLATLYECEIEKAASNLGRCSSEPAPFGGLEPSDAPQPKPPSPYSGSGILLPLMAFATLLERLIAQPSDFGSFFAIAQFSVGLLIVLWFGWGEKKSAPFYYFVLPLGTILAGCLVGWCTQMLMLAGLGLFGWLTSLAGLCCGGTGLGFVCYEFCVKAAELQTHHTVTRVLTGVDEIE
jgi:hypothetical protein